MLEKRKLKELYFDKNKSMMEIADSFGCSAHQVAYWMNKYGLKCRSHSEATYVKCNPNGDPFSFRKPRNAKEAQLFGLGLGLYWGEGTKAAKNSIRLGNTDPRLIFRFIEFLVSFFAIPKTDLRFGLQIFTDINPHMALDFWVKELKISRKQFYKITVTKSRSLGTYRQKSQFGVLTVYYLNKKARDILVGSLPK